LVVLLTAQFTAAQTVDFSVSREPVAELQGSWRFHVGDPPAGGTSWASSEFDDSSWQLLPFDHSWDVAGYRQTGGDCWYRVKVFVPANHPPLALLIPAIYSSYQVFADGQLVGQVGGLPPHAEVLLRYQDNLLVPIPSNAIPASGNITLAFRIWHWPRWNTYPGTDDITLKIGDAALLAHSRDLIYRETFWSNASSILICFCYLVASLAGFLIYSLRRAEREYLWFALFEISSAIQTGLELSRNYFAMPFPLSEALVGLFGFSTGLLFLFFLATILRERRGWLFWIIFTSLLCSGLVSFLSVWGIFNPFTFALILELATFPSRIVFVVMLVRSARRGNLDARLLLAPVSLVLTAFFLGGVADIAFSASNIRLYHAFDWYFEITRWPFHISFMDLTQFLTLLAILAILILRFARSRRDEERLKGELEAARIVQQVLVPEAIPDIPGFTIQSVYRPFSQVGGDFFQILPLAEGGVMVVIGDVSGKGMPAAMTVSLLVGTVRTLAHYTQSPAEILSAMNRRMLGRSAGGFTTCLVLSVSSAGILTAATAGHIPPYLNGHDLLLENGLPLGIAAGITYPETTFTLPPSARLTLITDGVLEATNPTTKELFGFERTAAISTQSAGEIAAAAQSFGQEDDITVLTIALSPAEVLHA
jgi:hypothetical protein